MTTEQLPPEVAEPETEPSHELSLLDGLRWIYRFFYSKKVGLGLILALGLFSLFGTLLTQAPPAARVSAESWAAWVDQVRPKYGGWTDILATLGLFNVFSSWWFVTTSALLALSIAACTIHRLPRLWAAATAPKLSVRDAFFDHARLRDTVDVPTTAEAALARVRAGLGAARFRVLDAISAGDLYADRFRWAPFGTAAAHLAFILILLGVLVSSIGGFRDEDFTVTAGFTREVGHGTNLALQLESFTDLYYPDGRASDYASQVVLFENGTQVAQHTIRVNDPLRWGGITFYQATYGTAAELLITDATGKELFRDGIALDRTTEDHQTMFGKLTMSNGVEVYVVAAASGAQAAEIKPGELLLEFYAPDSNKPMGRQVLTQGKPATVAELNFTFLGEKKFTGLIVAKDPGAIWIWIGSALLVAGTVATMFFRHRRIWVRVRENADGTTTVRLACPDRTDSIFTRQFHQLAASLKESSNA